jgi:hypothetical protein
MVCYGFVSGRRIEVAVLLKDPVFDLALAASALLVALAVYIIFQRRLTPVERERRRRVALNLGRRTAEGFITEAGCELIHYQYEVQGVTYFASQDVTALGSLLPEDPGRLIGAASVKFDPRNPANSIVVCEEWSGLPVRKELTHG